MANSGNHLCTRESERRLGIYPKQSEDGGGIVITLLNVVMEVMLSRIQSIRFRSELRCL